MKIQYFREMLIALFAVSLGWWVHARPVLAADTRAAATTQPLAFQLGNIGPQTALTLYNPADQTFTVYTGATTGSEKVQCTYQYTVTKPGGPIYRRNCQPGSLLP